VSGAGPYIWNVWKGSRVPYIFTIKDSLGERLDLTGVQIRLQIVRPGSSFVFVSGVDPEVVVPDQTGDMQGEVHVTLTPAFTRLLPDGQIAKFEMEAYGFLDTENEVNVLWGEIRAAGGLNPDGVL
jgi:hypothetical protein